MKRLSELLPRAAVMADAGGLERPVGGICCDSEQVQPGDVFVAICGTSQDGHAFIPQARDRGAAAVVGQRAPDGAGPYVQVADSRAALAHMAAAFYDWPARQMKVIGVTGTNGKTTVTHFIRTILEQAGWTVGLIGTNENRIGPRALPAERTTPDALQLQKLLRQMADAGCQAVVMEVSSHALALQRVAGIEFDQAVFTNLTQDHLDFHKTMAEYGAAKARLFQIARIGIANLDDNYYDMLMRQSACPLISYSLEQAAADLSAKQAVYYPSSVQFLALAEGQLARVKVPIPGKFTIYNALAALASARELGIDFNQAARALGKVGHVKGRAEIVPVPAPYTVMIDYAHTPDGMENILTAARGFCRGRLIVLFGCGGDRDRAKRPLMGRVADRLADQCIVTSDNPRSEAPEQIIREIVAGMGDTRREVIPDRRRAIARALEMAQKDDVVLLLGKGHETYQQIGQEKVHLDEREEIARFFADEGS